MCRLDHPICLFQDPNLWFRFSLWLKFVSYLLVILFLLVLGCLQVHGVLGTARTSQSEPVYLLLRRNNLVVVVVGQPMSNLPQIKFMHTHQKIRNNPLSHHVVIRARFFGEWFTVHYLPIVQKYKNRIELKFQTHVWALLICLVLCLLSLLFTLWCQTRVLRF